MRSQMGHGIKDGDFYPGDRNEIQGRSEMSIIQQTPDNKQTYADISGRRTFSATAKKQALTEGRGSLADGLTEDQLY